jgi:hypothetical protein
VVRRMFDGCKCLDKKFLWFVFSWGFNHHVWVWAMSYMGRTMYPTKSLSGAQEQEPSLDFTWYTVRTPCRDVLIGLQLFTPEMLGCLMVLFACVLLTSE